MPAEVYAEPAEVYAEPAEVYAEPAEVYPRISTIVAENPASLFAEIPALQIAIYTSIQLCINAMWARLIKKYS